MTVTSIFNRQLLDRRTFLHAASIGFASLLTPSAAEAIGKCDALFGSAFMNRDGRYGFALLSESGQILWQTELPDRGHDAVVSPTRRTLVVFARRPGNFAVVIDLDRTSSPLAFSAPAERHFYGHGAFSSDGRLLYTTENDFDNANGVIGIYDATGDFSRIGEIEAHGIGPHEIILMPDGNTLAVANGGIETHPDFGRAKLNLADMRPSLTLVNTVNGDLIGQHTLPTALHQLSIRHMDVTADGKIVFGCQDEGQASDSHSLVGWLDRAGQIGLYAIPDAINTSFRRYVGSVCLSADERVFAVSSPKGGSIAVLDTDCGNVVHHRKQAGVCGLAKMADGIVASSAYGDFLQVDDASGPPRYPTLAFDNHLTSL